MRTVCTHTGATGRKTPNAIVAIVGCGCDAKNIIIVELKMSVLLNQWLHGRRELTRFRRVGILESKDL